MAKKTPEELAEFKRLAKSAVEREQQKLDDARALRKREDVGAMSTFTAHVIHDHYRRLVKAADVKKKLKKAVQPPCEHTDLKFEDGMLHLSCKKCKYTWVSVGHCPARAIHDISARGRMPRHPTRQAPGTRSDIT